MLENSSCARHVLIRGSMFGQTGLVLLPRQESKCVPIRRVSSASEWTSVSPMRGTVSAAEWLYLV